MASGEVSLIGAGVSVLLPLILGFAALTAIAPPRLLSVLERLGLAYPLGAVLTTAPIYALGYYAGLRFDRIDFALIPGTLMLLCMVIAVWRRRAAGVGPPPYQGGVRGGFWCRADFGSPAQGDIPSLGWALPITLSAVAVCMLVFVVFEVLHRPLSPADSFTVWGLRAKVWAARGDLVLNRSDPFYLGCAVRPDYPPHVSLLQTWTAVWLGEWHEVLVDLPWACYYASALLFAFATLSRQLPRTWALCGACVLATTPFFVVHAAMAGYADLILAVHFAAAAVAVYLWASEGVTAYLVIGLLLAVSLVLIKLEGVPLLVTCAAGAIMQMGWLRHGGRRWWLIIVVALIAVVFAWNNLMLRGLLANARWHGEAAIPLLQSLAEFGTFQFLWPLFLVAGFVTLKRRWGSPLAWLFATVSAPLLPFSAVFLFTDAAPFGVNQGAPSRLLLHLAPAAVCFIVLAGGHLVSETGLDARTRRRRSKRAAVPAAVLVLGLAAVLGARLTPGLHWDLPSSDWQLDVKSDRAMLHYTGPPIDIGTGSRGVAVTLKPGIDGGPLAIDWRRSGNSPASRVRVHVRRSRPFVFVDLSAQSAWAGRLVALTLTLFPELADAVVGVDIPRPGLGGRLWSAWRSFWNPEILDPRTINILEGAQLVDLPLALLASGLWVVMVLTAALAIRTRARLRLARGLIVCTLALWTVCSARFAWDLLATYRVDQRRFSDSAEDARLDTLGSEFEALVAAAQRTIPPDAPTIFLSSLPLYTDRSQYALYPRPVVNCGHRLMLVPPQYAVLFRPAPGSYDPRRLRILTRPSGVSAVAKYEDPQE